MAANYITFSPGAVYPVPRDAFMPIQHGSHIHATIEKRRNEWQPITYASLKGWMFLNYLLLILLMALIGISVQILRGTL